MVRLFLFLISSFIFLSCGSKKNGADSAHDGELVNEGSLGKWAGVYSKEGISNDSGQLIGQIPIELYLYKDDVFVFIFDSNSALYLKGTFSLLSDEIAFTIEESKYEAFASVGEVLIADYEVSADTRMTLRFGEKRFILLSRNGNVIGKKPTEAPAQTEPKAYICKNENNYTVSISLDEINATFSAGIYPNGQPSSKAPLFQGDFKKSANGTFSLTINSKKNDVEDIQGFTLKLEKDKNSGGLSVIYPGERKLELGCKVGD